MSVYDNLAFPLRNRKLPETELDERVQRVAKMLSMQNQLKQTVTNSIKLLCQRNEINADKIQKMFQAYEQDKLIPQRIWHLVALEKWFEEFIDPGVHLLNS